MAGDTVRRREEPFEAPRPAPRIDLSQVRISVREQLGQTLSREQQAAPKLLVLQFNAIDRQISRKGDPALRRRWNDTSLKSLFG